MRPHKVHTTRLLPLFDVNNNAIQFQRPTNAKQTREHNKSARKRVVASNSDFSHYFFCSCCSLSPALVVIRASQFSPSHGSLLLPSHPRIIICDHAPGDQNCSSIMLGLGPPNQHFFQNLSDNRSGTLSTILQITRAVFVLSVQVTTIANFCSFAAVITSSDLIVSNTRRRGTSSEFCS